MDYLVSLIVRLICLFSGVAKVLPSGAGPVLQPGEKVKILLAGYNGARNTGSDVRVAALAQQLIDEFGADNVEISVMTLDEDSTSVYFQETARQIPFSTLFFGKLYRACSEHHVIVLSEGSTLKSTFADALTLYNCQAAGIARAQGKPCVAYGSEIGSMEPYLERTAQDLCTDTHFLVRSAGSDRAREKLGFAGHVGVDTAWTFDSSKGHDRAIEILTAGGWDGTQPLLGIAPINPFCWPVKSSFVSLLKAVLSGERSLQYQAWYFFSWSEEREARFHAYLDSMAAACQTFCAERGFMPVIFGMEQLDKEACGLMNERLGGHVPMILSNDTDGYVITEALRSLSLLVTSRYHAQVLASTGLVPAVAVSMDERLDYLAAELDAPDGLLLRVDDPDLAPKVLLGLDYAYENRSAIADSLAKRVAVMQEEAGNQAAWFASYVSSSNSQAI